ARPSAPHSRSVQFCVYVNTPEAADRERWRWKRAGVRHFSRTPPAGRLAGLRPPGSQFRTTSEQMRRSANLLENTRWRSAGNRLWPDLDNLAAANCVEEVLFGDLYDPAGSRHRLTPR